MQIISAATEDIGRQVGAVTDLVRVRNEIAEKTLQVPEVMLTRNDELRNRIRSTAAVSEQSAPGAAGTRIFKLAAF